MSALPGLSYPRSPRTSTARVAKAAGRGQHGGMSLHRRRKAARLPLDEEIPPADLPPRTRARSSAASGRSPAATRRAAVRSPGRSLPPRSFSIPTMSARARRFQEAHAGAARGAVRAHLRPRAGGGRDGAAVRASIATISCALRCGRWRARSRRCRSSRSSSLSTAATASMPVAIAGGHRRRRAGRLDRRRLDRRQGDARPADDAARRRASGLRLRTPHGLQRARAFRRARPARPDHPSPPLVLAGRRCARLVDDKADDLAAAVLPL